MSKYSETRLIDKVTDQLEIALFRLSTTKRDDLEGARNEAQTVLALVQARDILRRGSAMDGP